MQGSKRVGARPSLDSGVSGVLMLGLSLRLARTGTSRDWLPVRESGSGSWRARGLSRGESEAEHSRRPRTVAALRWTS